MKILRTDGRLFVKWIGLALTILLFACSGMGIAQDNKKKDEAARPAGNATKPANPPSGQSHQQAPQRQANPAPAQSAPPAPSRPSNPNPAQSTPQQNMNRPDRSNSGQGNSQNTDRQTNQQQNPVRPNNPSSGQGMPQQNANRPDRSNSGQGNPQNTDRQTNQQQNPVRPNNPSSGQGMPQQNTNRPDRSNSGQGNPQNTDRPVYQQQNPVRPNNPSSGQGMPQQNTNRPDRPSSGQGIYQPSTQRPANQGGGQNSGQGIYQNSGGRQGGPGGGTPRPQTIRTENGGTIHRDAGGQVRQVHTPNGAVITHQANGMRRIEMTRPGNRVIVTDSRGHGGYIQRPLMVSNHQYIQRTYSVRGVAYARVYRPVVWGGVSLHVYTPVRYYRPAFYAYVYTPWSRPVYYDWGWSSRPWYGYYGGYFTPYPSYGSPSLWLTDFMLGAMLERAYDSRMENAAAYSGGQVGITPDVKQAVADEVRRQLDMERSEGQSQNAGYNDPQSIFADNARHVFVAYQPLGVSSNAGDCMITEGDVLQLYGNPGPSAANADVVVLASKGMDCRRGAIASVPVQELQEMQNEMRATLDQGLQDFQSRNGKGGLPALPPATDGVFNASFASSVTPDANVAGELSQVAQEADRSEQDVVRQADNAPAGSAPMTITLGQTIQEVVGMLNQPEKVVDLGAKKIYVYKDMKITFTDGRVTDVQ